MGEKFANWKKTTVFRSRTILTIALTVIAFVATKFFGMPDLDWKSVVDTVDGLQVEEIFALAGLVIAAFFRKNQQTDLSKPSNG